MTVSDRTPEVARARTIALASYATTMPPQAFSAHLDAADPDYRSAVVGEFNHRTGHELDWMDATLCSIALADYANKDTGQRMERAAFVAHATRIAQVRQVETALPETAQEALPGLVMAFAHPDGARRADLHAFQALVETGPEHLPLMDALQPHAWRQWRQVLGSAHESDTAMAVLGGLDRVQFLDQAWDLCALWWVDRAEAVRAQVMCALADPATRAAVIGGRREDLGRLLVAVSPAWLVERAPAEWAPEPQ